jgi:hypothetical protein
MTEVDVVAGAVEHDAATGCPVDVVWWVTEPAVQSVPEESFATRPLFSSSFQEASSVPGNVAPRALRGTPDTDHTTTPSITAKNAASSAISQLTVIFGKRIFQCEPINTPKLAPTMFVRTSTIEGLRCPVTSWTVSASIATTVAVPRGRKAETSKDNADGHVPQDVREHVETEYAEAPVVVAR